MNIYWTAILVGPNLPISGFILINHETGNFFTACLKFDAKSVEWNLQMKQDWDGITKRHTQKRENLQIRQSIGMIQGLEFR